MNDRYRVTLAAKPAPPERKKWNIRYVRALRLAFPAPLDLKEAFDFAEQVNPPFILMDGVDHATAEQAVKALQQGGADARMDPSDYPSPMRFFRPDLDKPSGCLSTLFASVHGHNGMKKRTRVFAWIFTVGVGLSAVISMSTVLGFPVHPGDLRATGGFRVLMVICLFESLISAVGWINLLDSRAWAWKMLVWLYLAYVVQFFVVAGRYAGLLPVVLVFLLQCVLPLWVLLTDRPSGWSQPVNPQSEVPSPQ